MNDTTKPRQLPLDLGHEPGYSRDDLIVSGTNMAAVDIVDRWPNWISPVVILAGPTGSGKTHLAAVWKAEFERNGHRCAQYRWPPLVKPGLF